MTLAGIRQFLLPRLMQLALIQQKRLLQLCNHRSRCYSWQRGERTDEKGPKGIIPHCTAKCGGGVATRSACSEGARVKRFSLHACSALCHNVALCSICQEAKRGEGERERETRRLAYKCAPSLVPIYREFLS